MPVTNKGFTLTELLVVMVISGIVMAGIYATYYTQQKSYLSHEQLVALQQNLRAVTYVMEREIRMAGCDPTCAATSPPGILTAGRDTIRFRSDVDRDKDTTDEDITYEHIDSDADLVRDQLTRNTDPIAENIDALDFVYLDEDGAPLDDDGSGNVTTSIAQIRSMQITIVARKGREDPGYKDTKVYYNQQDLVNPILPAQNDSFRRRLLTTSIRCRNLGL